MSKLSSASAIKKICLSATLIVIALLGAAVLVEQRARSNALRDYPSPGEVYLVDGAPMHIHCLGTASSSPTVVFEYGWGGNSYLWLPLMEKLAGQARVCAYDRAGSLWSAYREYADPAEPAEHLRQLLAMASIEGQVILVAHSLGGAYARIFAGEYPDRVAALILVDSVHHDMLNRVDVPDRSSLPLSVQYPRATRWLGEIGVVRAIAKSELPGVIERNPDLEEMFTVAANYAPNQVRGKAWEYNSAPQLHAKSAAYARFKNIPVVVISRGRKPDKADESVKRHYAIWQELQRDLLTISSESRQVIAANSGHNIPMDAPELVQHEILLALTNSSEAMYTAE